MEYGVELVIPFIVAGDSAVVVESKVILKLTHQAADAENLPSIVGADGAKLVSLWDKTLVEVKWVHRVREYKDGVQLLAVGIVEMEKDSNPPPDVD